MILTVTFSFSAFAQEELSSTQIKKYKNGIFEVVTLKLEDTTVYKEEFPHKLIPFHLRNDKYHSLGTAFLIKQNTFVSAAHVFNIGYKSQLSDNYAVRDSKGNIFKITNVEKYSNYRDLIQFSVEGDTSAYHEFTIANEYEEGDVIYAAGNAHGEGVIFRKGTLTSFTYEPIDGKWKNIRFSAAASPGNSGGPLLNLAGEVVGIVTMKSNSENLNYAFPIKEFMAFSTEQAEFFNSQMGEVESTKSLTYTWDFKVDLPQEIITLRKLAEKSFYDRFETGRTEFVTKYGKEIFPKHENVQKYLLNQSNSEIFSIIDINGNGEWLLFEPPEEKEVKIDNKQSMWFSSNDKMMGSYQFFMEKPSDTSLQAFITNKKNILDTFLTSVKWNRTIANTPVYITSYGEPVYEESYVDNFGRPWQMAAWHDQYGDTGLMIYCLPMPQGIVCDFITTSTSWLEVQKKGYRVNLPRIMLSYTAKLSEWKEFLQLPQNMLPTFLHDAKVEVSENDVTFDLGSFSGNMKNMELSGDSNFYAAVEISPENTDELVVGYIGLRPNINEDGFYSVAKLYDLKNDASDSYRDFWEKLTTLKSPYNFEVIDEGKTVNKYINLGAKNKSPKTVGKNKDDQVYLATCTMQSEVELAKFTSACDAFVNGLH
jgi:V8-like Glu-specific endopeptidase